LLLVPYYSWKISHRRHHANTGSIEKDEVFVPMHKPETDPDPAKLSLTERFAANYLPTPVLRAGKLVGDLSLGWPLYLLFNVASRPHDAAWVSHFNPWSPIFSRRERILVRDSKNCMLCIVPLRTNR
jgi:omega-6 fatty acid desaturase (delta-12 desaturase)